MRVIVLSNLLSLNTADATLALILLANIKETAKEDYGAEFCPTIQTMQRRYMYKYAHNTTSLRKMLKELVQPIRCMTLRVPLTQLQREGRKQ